MKGFTDKSGKFRPTENKNGVRKSRDQTAKTEGVRLKREDHLPEFVKSKIASNLVDLEIMTRDLREQSRVKHALGEPTGQVDSELNLITGAKNNIFTLLEKLPEEEHEMIIRKYDQELQEFLPR